MMSDHNRRCRTLALGERQELRRTLAQLVAVERREARDPEAEEDREQQDRVIESLA
jgi:hypothetical protein